jgi:hypothetical protein
MKAKIEAHHQSLEPCEELVGKWKVKKVTHDIMQSIKQHCMFFLDLFQRHVMQKVLVDLVVVDFVPESINS